MRMNHALAGLAAASLLASLAPSNVRAEPTYESKRLERPIVIDGEASEWAGQEVHYDVEDGYKLGFFNDDGFLYVYFATWNLSTQQRVLENGLTVWFDGGGKKKKTFGINYPRSRDRGPGTGADAPAGVPPFGDAPGEAGDEAPRRMPRSTASPDPAKLASLLEEMRGEATLKSPAGDSLMLVFPDTGSSDGLRVMLQAKSRLLVIEMRVPLGGDEKTPYAIRAVQGKAVSVGFETGSMQGPKMQRPEGMPSDDRMGGNMPSGGGPPAGGRPPGGMGAPEAPEGLKLWVKVKLAR